MNRECLSLGIVLRHNKPLVPNTRRKIKAIFFYFAFATSKTEYEKAQRTAQRSARQLIYHVIKIFNNECISDFCIMFL